MWQHRLLLYKRLLKSQAVNSARSVFNISQRPLKEGYCERTLFSYAGKIVQSEGFEFQLF